MTQGQQEGNKQGSKQGRLIVLEGIEGVHLEEFAHQLALYLANRGVKRSQIRITRQPSDGPVGRDIRLALRGRLQLDKRTLAVLFAADRLDHLHVPETGIEARLQKGDWIILDRYYLSQYAFQTYQGFDLDWLRALNRHCRRPDLTFYIELPMDTCIGNYQAQLRLRGYHYSLLSPAGVDVPDRAGYERAKEYLEAIRERYRSVIEELRGEEDIEVIEASTTREATRLMRRALDKRNWF